MSTFSHPDLEVPITLPADGLTKDQLLSFRPFREWLSTLTHALSLQGRPGHPFHATPYSLVSIAVQAHDAWGSPSPRVGFVKLRGRVENAEGGRLDAAVFLRGASVAMLVVLVPEDKKEDKKKDDDKDVDKNDDKNDDDPYGERFVVLTVQPRVPAGSLAFVELPAGMVDDEGSFAGAAAREIKEELGIEIKERDLVCLTDLAGEARDEGDERNKGIESSEGDEETERTEKPGGTGGRGRGAWQADEEGLPHAVFPSAGGCDECVRIYLHERRVPRDRLGEWEGKLTGLRDEGEKITLKLVPMRELWREGARDAKALSALALWEGLRRDGRL